MNKYELAVVVSAKIEDDERAAVVDKCKALIERFGGTITNVDEIVDFEASLTVNQILEMSQYYDKSSKVISFDETEVKVR